MNDDEHQARALFAQGDFAEAEALFRKRALAAPDDPVAQYNLGVTLGKMDLVVEAMSFYRRTIELNPGFADAYINFGTCLNELNLIEQAQQSFALARQIAPDNPVPVLNAGIAALALGDYETGWAAFAARWQLPAYAKFKRAFAQPYWNGEELAGKILFLFAEQGFGDTLQMARYVPLLAARGAKIIIEAPPALMRLLRSLNGAPRVITKGEKIPVFDFYCSMLDIPRAFGTRLENIPAQTPYLLADAVESAAFPARSEKRRVGLCWAGRSSHENDGKRSLKFSQLAPLLAHQEIEWISLQRVVPDGDVSLLSYSPVWDWGRKFADFGAAAAAVTALDLVITVDTAIAHLAGALGKPVWVLLPFYADWRWLTQRADSPWYPTARLFRQERRCEWEAVLSEVENQLSNIGDSF
ncbi:MAG: hypothetical protein P4M13_00610 [Alphaproteobacteria bacterium]|nr:hypothetical protein [Alphaproteobacteria bacterium]